MLSCWMCGSATRPAADWSCWRSCATMTRFAGVRVVMHTSEDWGAIGAEVNRLGVDAFVAKPADPDRLMAAIVGLPPIQAPRPLADSLVA